MHVVSVTSLRFRMISFAPCVCAWASARISANAFVDRKAVRKVMRKRTLAERVCIVYHCERINSHINTYAENHHQPEGSGKFCLILFSLILKLIFDYSIF